MLPQAPGSDTCRTEIKLAVRLTVADVSSGHGRARRHFRGVHLSSVRVITAATEEDATGEASEGAAVTATDTATGRVYWGVRCRGITIKTEKRIIIESR